MNVYIGYDPREHEAYEVARFSIERRIKYPRNFGIGQIGLDGNGAMVRPVERRNGGLWCPISEAPMSTEFAISRFATFLIQRGGWSVFMDCDVLLQADIEELFALADPQYAVQVVKHSYVPPVIGAKMDGQIQTRYDRKNWSSVMLINNGHPANQRLTFGMLNNAPGRNLHAFCWLGDGEIGELPPEWNHLVGVHQKPTTYSPKLLHYTLGGPWLPEYRDCQYSTEWHREREALRCGVTCGS